MAHRTRYDASADYRVLAIAATLLLLTAFRAATIMSGHFFITTCEIPEAYDWAGVIVSNATLIWVAARPRALRDHVTRTALAAGCWIALPILTFLALLRPYVVVTEYESLYHHRAINELSPLVRYAAWAYVYMTLLLAFSRARETRSPPWLEALPLGLWLMLSFVLEVSMPYAPSF